MRVLSIEIGLDITHVAEVDYKVKNPKIYQAFSFRTPFGVASEAGIRKNEEFRTILNRLLRARKVKTRKALFVVNSSKIASREVEIPNVKENRIRDLLNANSAEYFPVDLAQYQLVYRMVEPEVDGAKGKTEDKGKNRKLFIFAVPNDLVTSYEEAAAFYSLELVNLDYMGNSVHQLMRRVAGGNIACTVKVDDNATMITIIQHGEVVLQRTIFYGVGEAYSLVEESGVFSGREYPSIQALMEKELYLNARMDMQTQGSGDALAELRNEVTESLRPMIGNVGRVLDYYQSRNAGAEVRECILIGSGACMKGLDALMGVELNIPVRAMASERLGTLGINPKIKMTEYFACYGAALAPLEFVFGGQHRAQIIRAKKKRELLVFRLFFLTCVVSSVVLMALEGFSYLTHQTRRMQLEREKNNLAYIENIFDSYVETLVRYADVLMMEAQTRTTSSGLADAFAEMEAKLPSSITVSSLTSDGTGVSLEVTVDSKSEVAKTLEVLRDFDAFRSVTTGGINEVTDEAGRTSVNFSVMCVYVNGTEGIPEDTETTPEEDVNTYMNGDAYLYPDYSGENTETGDTEHE